MYAARTESGAIAGSAAGRVDAIDVYRGFVLCTIFINHIPGNIFETLTYRNVSLSDSTEAFVFLSGLAIARAYGPRFAEGARQSIVFSLLRRALRLYGLHLALSLAGIAIFVVGTSLSDDMDLCAAHGRAFILANPLLGTAGLASLGYQIGYFNILPLYVVLVAAIPAFLWLACLRRWLMLAVSGLVYVTARCWCLNLPTWPLPGGWFLNPLTWQLLFATGIAFGFGPALSGPAITRQRTIVATLVVGVAAALVTDGFGLLPGLRDATQPWIDADKTMLGLGRLVHFLALAYLVVALDPAGRLRATPLFEPLRMMGRHGLWVFGVTSVLTAIGQVLFATVRQSPWFDVLLIGPGLVALYATAWLLEARRLRAGTSGHVVPGAAALAPAHP